MPARLMVHEKDPAKQIWDTLKESGINLKDFQLQGNQVLLATYLRPEKTKSGILLPDGTRGEDVHQGKSSLCILKGPAAFKSDASYDFQGFDVAVGDWVAIWVSDGRKIMLGQQLCRIVDDQFIRIKLPSPDCVF